MSAKLFLAAALTLCTLVTGCQKEPEKPAPRPAAAPASEGTVVAVGDSLTAGYGLPPSEAYPAQLEQKLQQAGYRWQVVNAGISGETSSGTLSRVDWILKLHPDIIILETGANDGLRGIDPKLTRRNIEEIVTLLEARHVVVVLAGMKALTNMGGPFTEEFAAIYPSIAQKNGLILVPFFLAEVAGKASLNQQDGIHPTGAGYRIVTDTIYPYLLQAIEKKRGH